MPAKLYLDKMHFLQFRRLAVAAIPGIFIGAALTAVSPSKALTIVCTPTWASSSPGNPATGSFTSVVAPCPSTPSAVTINNIQTGPSAGVVFSNDWQNFAFSSQYVASNATSIGIGQGSGYSISFGEQIMNPYLYFNFIDFGTEFVFGQPIELVGATNASVSGNTVTPTGGSSDRNTDGFVVRVLGTFGGVGGPPVTFDFNNVTPGPGGSPSVAFTAGGYGTAVVPGPLPLMGAGVAFGFSRRLRRRIKAES